MGKSHFVELKIVEMVRKKKLMPGGRLPSERALAAEFKVSRNTIREAIRGLAEKKILSCRRGSGSYVAANAGDLVAARLKTDLENQKKRLAQIFEVRKILEPGVARKAAKVISSRALEKMEKMLSLQKAALASGQDTTEYDKKFHEILVKSTNNSVLWSVFTALTAILEESRKMQSAERAGHSVDSHVKILACLKARDGQGAYQAMSEHMDGVEDILTRMIEESK
ncbi:MAG: FadR family transcriptional regulator [Desulfobacter sp.]|nr:FadR family transcriptional regulator [Desulfobacter sp.]WDP87510.1 MAG: FadR family transcriptional regulator [Desulfobacter sp.]